MLGGYYTIASGMLSRQRELDVIGNNLVNTRTPGYRADRLVISSFQQELLTRMESGGKTVLGNGKASTATIVGEVVPLFQGGTIEATDRSTDMAINGEGFFNIQAKDGSVSLTRSGQFDLDEEGYLMLPGFGRVLGEGGPLKLERTDFSVETDGTVYDHQGRQVGRLLVTVPPNGTPLVKQTNGMFRFPNGVTGVASTNYAVLQKNLEQSNVDMNQEMTNLIEAQRGFQSCASALQIMDALNRKAASQLGAL